VYETPWIKLLAGRQACVSRQLNRSLGVRGGQQKIYGHARIAAGSNTRVHF
jgi:hypothetical protein